MIKWILLVLVFLVPAANAIILLDNLERDLYNIGEKVVVSGYLLEDKDMFGRFQLELACDEINPLVVRGFNIRRGARFDFHEEIPLFFDSENPCYITVSLYDNQKVIDQTKTNDFTVTSELIGNFSIKDNLIQLGKPIEVYGNVNKLGGDLVNGIATLFFTQGGEVFFVDTAEVKAGVFYYNKNLIDNLPGDYFMDVEVMEFFGNKFLFDSVLKFTLVNEISVFVDTDRDSSLPGASVTVFGEASTILQDVVENGEVTIYLDEEDYRANIKKNGQFDYRLEIPMNITSGKHEIKAVVVDLYGNVGESETSLEIIPLPSLLDIEFEKKTYLPNDVLKFKPFLYDQAGEIIDESVKIEFITPEKEVMRVLESRSNTDSEFLFPDNAVPGTWRMKLANNNLEELREFLVGSLSALDYTIDNGILIVENVGNVKYENPINIKIKGGGVDISLTKKTSLKPEKILRVDLGREVETGVYQVAIGDKIFDDVEIASTKGQFDFTYLYWILIIFALILFVYFLFFRTRRKILRKVKEKRLIEGAGKKEKTHEDYKKEFRNRMLRQIEERDKKVRKTLEFGFGRKSSKGEGFRILGKDKIEEEKRKNQEKKSGGLFGMFD